MCAAHISILLNILLYHLLPEPCVYCFTGSCSTGDREGPRRGKTVSSSQLYQGGLPQTGSQGESFVFLNWLNYKYFTKWSCKKCNCPVRYRSWSTPMSTTWRHFAQNRPTKKHMCAHLLIALTMTSLLWTRTAGQRTAWWSSHANFNPLDRDRTCPRGAS